jgi:hypothetical protein
MQNENRPSIYRECCCNPKNVFRKQPERKIIKMLFTA